MTQLNIEAQDEAPSITLPNNQTNDIVQPTPSTSSQIGHKPLPPPRRQL